MIKKKYEELKKKHGLPDFVMLDNEFEISVIDKPEFLLRSIKRKICEKLEFTSEILAKMIQPETSQISDLYEYRCFDESAKNKIFELYSRVMFLLRKITVTDLLLDISADAEVIKHASVEWPELRKEIHPFVKKLEACWEKIPESDKEMKEYLG